MKGHCDNCLVASVYPFKHCTQWTSSSKSFTTPQMYFLASIQKIRGLVCFYLSNVANNVNRFPFVELSLHGWDKPFLVSTYYSL